MKKNQKGLTLIELIVVVVLIGILVLIAITYFRAQIFKGNDAKRKADIRRIQIAVEEYEKDHDCYPLSLPSCNPGTSFTPYIDKIPCDPLTGTSYYYDHQDSICPTWSRLYTVLENKSDKSTKANIGPYGAFNYEASSPNAPDTVVSLSSPPPSSDGGGGIQLTDFYSCKNHVCVPIGWNSSITGPDCHPNFRSSNCYNVCPTFEDCVPQN